jgi:hypothetical protein
MMRTESVKMESDRTGACAVKQTAVEGDMWYRSLQK